MLPELDFKRSWGMDKAMYFDKRLKEFFVKNKDVKEQISKYNAQTLILVREAKELLNIQRRKFGMLFHVAINMKDQETIGHVRVIHGSLKEQLRMVENLDGYLLRVKLDEKWANAIKEFVYDKITERCSRLERMILPDLIQFSKVNIYAYYLQTKGTTLEQDIINHFDDDDDVYYAHIMNTIEICEKTLPEEKIAEFAEAREKHVAAQARRKEIIDKEKKQQKLEKRQDFEKDAVIMLQNWATDMVTMEQRVNSQRNRLLYSHALEKLEKLNDKLTGEDLTFKLIAVVKYNSQNRIASSAFRWLRVKKNGDYMLSQGLGGAEPFFTSLEPEKYEAALKHCEEQGYITAIVECDITGKKEEPVVYDYYRAIPEITWNPNKRFYDISDEERAIYMEKLFCEMMNVLKCVYIIREAYSVYGEAAHPVNQSLDLKELRYLIHEASEFEGCWNDKTLLQRKREEDCKAIRTRMSVLKSHSAKKLQYALNFPLTDVDGNWADVIKSVINVNSYVEEDLEKIYAVIEGLNQSQKLPESFTNIEKHRGSHCEVQYRIAHNRYEKGREGYYGWIFEEIKELEYVRAYLSYHEPLFTKESFR